MFKMLLLGLLVWSRVATALWPDPLTFTSQPGALWTHSDLSARFSCGDGAVVWDMTAAGLSTDQSLFDRSQLRLTNLLGSWQATFGLSSDIDDGNDALSPSEDTALRSAVRRALKAVVQTTFVPWKFHSRGTSFEPMYYANATSLKALKISQRHCPQTEFSPARFFDGDESYELTIDNGVVFIESNSSVGTINGLQTFKQLAYGHSGRSQSSYIPYTSLSITDRPHWQYRGISLDIARNPFNVDDVLRTIDAMESVKLNKLHIHATDSQSWPMEIPSLPELAMKGAYQPHLTWSPKDIARIQHYGISRNVQVFLELDMPGHTASIAHAYPDLIAAFNQLDWDTFAAEPLSGQFKLNSSKVHHFLDTLLDDLLPRLSTYTSIYHLGGDEVNRMVHLLDETVQSSDYAVLQPLIQSLMQQIYAKAIQNNLRPMLWEEMFLEWNLTLDASSSDERTPSGSPNKPLVQAWRSSANIVKLLRNDHKVIFGDSEHWYLDCGHGVFLSPYPGGKSPPGVPFNTSGGKATQLSPPYLDYCNPYHNWRAVYTFDPLANISEELWPGIEGGEALLWSELTDSVDLDAKLWPRAAAAAEVLWRGPRTADMLADATTRLAMWRERAVADLGVRSGMVQMTWCLMEGGCEL